jgi:hypothetical protein
MTTRNSNLLPLICSIDWAPVDHVDSISQGADRFHKSVSFVQGKNWDRVYHTPGSIEFTEKEKDHDGGTLIEQSCKFAFPGEDESNPADFDSMIGVPAIVRIGFSSGLFKIMGDKENPAKLSRILQHGVKSSGSQLEISCTASGRCCWIS